MSNVRSTCIRCVASALMFASLTLAAGSAAAVDATFVIDEQQSDLTIDASFSIFSDADTQALGGAIDMTFDFGTGGAFPSTAEITANSAAIASLADFELTLGFPPQLGVFIDVVGAAADVTTPSPPATLTLTGDPGVVFEFDAAEFDVTLNQGVVTVTGAENATFNLQEDPVTGTPPIGSLGRVTLTTVGAVGPFTLVDAILELPIVFTEVIEFEGQMVTLDVDGGIVANSSFAVALSGIPGNFDDDQDVDADDLAQWQLRYGVDFAGDDFLDWQGNLGTAPPVLVNSPTAAQGVPEPAKFLQLVAVALAGCIQRRRDRRPLR